MLAVSSSGCCSRATSLPLERTCSMEGIDELIYCSLDDGWDRYSCFGYTLDGADLLKGVQEGDVIASAKVSDVA